MRTWALPLCAALLACPQKPGPEQDAQVVAWVNGQAVGRAGFERELEQEMRTLDGSPRSPEQAEPFKRALLETLVTRTLLLQAARDAGISVSAEEVDRRLLALAAEYPEGLTGLLAQSGITKPELMQRTLEQLTVERLFRDQVDARVAVTEEAIRRYFDEHPEEFQEPEQVHAAQIVVRGLDDAKRIQQQLWAGKKFPDLARRYSLSPEAKVGGDLGFFARGTMPASFDEVVFRLAPNQVSEVVTTEFGFHLFKVLEKKPARKKELPEVRGGIEARLLAQLRKQAQEAWVKALREKAKVQVNERTLQQVTGRAPHGEKP